MLRKWNLSLKASNATGTASVNEYRGASIVKLVGAWCSTVELRRLGRASARRKDNCSRTSSHLLVSVITPTT
jgi:hypothetical protein